MVSILKKFETWLSRSTNVQLEVNNDTRNLHSLLFVEEFLLTVICIADGSEKELQRTRYHARNHGIYHLNQLNTSLVLINTNYHAPTSR